MQHEHIYELTIDGRAVSAKPLKTETPKSAKDGFSKRFEDRITAFVENKLEQAFEKEGSRLDPTQRE